MGAYADTALSVPPSTPDTASPPLQCEHLCVSHENGGTTCNDCGKIIKTSFLVVEYNIGMQRRKKKENTIYKEIPSFIEDETRETAIEIYRAVTGTEPGRTLRKAIMLACVHRASALRGDAVCFEDLVEHFGIKGTSASRGVSYVAQKIDRESPYVVSFFDSDATVTCSIVKNLDIENHLDAIERIIDTVKRRSDAFNGSQYKSVACGCVYFWLKILGRDVTAQQFAQRVKVSTMTVKKKLRAVTETILVDEFKRVFFSLLDNALPAVGDNHDTDGEVNLTSLDGLIDERNGLTIGFDDSVVDATGVPIKDHSSLIITTRDGRVLPLDDVTNVEEYNSLMDTTWSAPTSRLVSRSIRASVKKSDDEILFYFNDYDATNKTRGTDLVRAAIYNAFA